MIISKLIIDLTPRTSCDSSTKIRIQLQYDKNKLFVMVRHAVNLVNSIELLMMMMIIFVLLAIDEWK